MKKKFLLGFDVSDLNTLLFSKSGRKSQKLILGDFSFTYHESGALFIISSIKDSDWNSDLLKNIDVRSLKLVCEHLHKTKNGLHSFYFKEIFILKEKSSKGLKSSLLSSDS